MENQKSPVAKNSRFRRLRKLTQPKTLLIVFIVLAIAAVVVAWAGQRYEDYKIAQQTVQIPSEAEYFKKTKNDLLANQPSPSASEKEKVEYYDRLRNTYVDLKEYKMATDAYEKRISVSKDGLSYGDYIAVAETYHKAGDSGRAVSLLDEAMTALPESDNDETGFVRENFVKYIAEKRSEYSR